MRNSGIFIVLIISIMFLKACRVSPSGSNDSVQVPKQAGAYYSGIYPNLFTELLGKSHLEVQSKLDNAWKQLFYGDNATQRVYYPVDPNMAYIKDIAHNDVRSEGMSYGMMVAVQLDKKPEFDCLWNWAKTYMQHSNGPRKGYFAWQLNTNGDIIDRDSASDGEEWLVMALFFASARWGNGKGIYNYQAEAQAILDAMLSKEDASVNDSTITNMFNKTERQVVFVPVGSTAKFTNPSYHLPNYYELWSRWADKENRFWSEAATASRQFFKKVAHQKTGLMPDYARFNGLPMDTPWGTGHDDFRFDAWRVAMNVAVDYVWFAKDSWAVTQSNRLLDFFYSEGVNSYGNQYTLDGTRLSEDHSIGLVAMNAVACLASTNENRIDFVQELWNAPIPSGTYRYYDGMLYMLALLNVSGSFKIYNPTIDLVQKNGTAAN